MLEAGLCLRVGLGCRENVGCAFSLADVKEPCTFGESFILNLMESPQVPESNRGKSLTEGNDQFRRRLLMPQAGGRVVLTPGVAHSGSREAVLFAVASFRDFTADNDPYGEHDFGQLKVDGETYFFKIDYYADDSMRFGAEDPAKECFRLLTIMRSDEY